MDSDRVSRAGRIGARIGALVVITGLFGASIVSVSFASLLGHAAPKTLYVSAKGKGLAPCTQPKPCSTIARALGKAHKGDEVLVGHGTYKEEVKLTSDIRLIASAKPIIEAKGKRNGVVISGKKAAGAEVRGFTVRNANYEGILAVDTTDVAISENTVSGNDRGESTAKPAGECAPLGLNPGDCGQGLHLLAVTDSKVTANTVSGNSGGILLTDEKGPTAYNQITNNKVLDNLRYSGITLAGRNTIAVFLVKVSGVPKIEKVEPTLGGVYSNVISKNTVNANGTKGQGAGILLAGGAAGTAVYSNRIEDNTADGNGLGGVTLHSAEDGEDLDGNAITHNILSNDGLRGYPDGSPGDSEAGINQSVAIAIWSADTSLSGISLSANQISHDHYGIWTKNVPMIAKSANTFASTVVVALSQG